MSIGGFLLLDFEFPYHWTSNSLTNGMKLLAQLDCPAVGNQLSREVSPSRRAYLVSSAMV